MSVCAQCQAKYNLSLLHIQYVILILVVLSFDHDSKYTYLAWAFERFFYRIVLPILHNNSVDLELKEGCVSCIFGHVQKERGKRVGAQQAYREPNPYVFSLKGM